MRAIAAGLFAGAMALGVSGCGFTPVYAPTVAGKPTLGPILVSQVQGKSGHELSVALDRLLGAERGAAAAPRRIDVSLTEYVAGLGYRLDESASRADLVLVGAYTVFEPDGKTALKGTVNAQASYDIPASAYGEVAAQNAARARAADLLAERIRADLLLRLPPPGGGAAASATR
jgi:LPS-assembly lipoprotein